jgi:hypothetical protein
MMRSFSLAFLLLSACGYSNKGEPCASGGQNDKICNSGLVCCAPDPRVANQSGVCVDKTTLAKENEACGVSTSRCCDVGLLCEVDNATGSGRCIK